VPCAVCEQLAKMVNSSPDKVAAMLELTANAGQKKMFESGLTRLERFAAVRPLPRPLTRPLTRPRLGPLALSS
jgi:hypothetical protein